MRINKLIFLISIFFPVALFSQMRITGKIVDTESKPVEFAEIILMTNDSIALKSELSNENGNFQIENKNGNYIIQIRQLGTILYSKSLVPNKNIDLGIIKVETSNTLQEIVITGSKRLIERKVDRLVFNVENSIAATGGDAIDALKVTPGLRVQNDAITMIGKSGMAVMVDDRLMQLSGDDLINFLKTIQSDNIKSIEVITTPPAKYSAEGNSGIINIKLKKAKIDSWSASVNSAYRQSTYAIESVGGNYNYQKNKISIFSNVNTSNGATAPVETSKIYYPNQLWSNNSQRKDFNNSIGGRIGIDYQLSKKWSMGIQYLGSRFKPNIEENNLTTITDYNNIVNLYIKTDAKNNRTFNSNSFNWHTIYTIDTVGTKISVDFDYFKFNSKNDRGFKSNSLDLNNNIIPNSFVAANNKNENNIVNYSAKIDVEMPLKLINLSYGGKISHSNNNSNVLFYDLTSSIPVFDANQSNEFIYKENLGALYLTGTKKIGEKWETQIGLRMETTKTDGISNILNQENKNNYNKLFPTAYIVYTHNENNVFSLNYSKRINRPPFFSLNPFRWYSNPYSYSEGNPFLQPAYGHNLEFSFTHNQNWENKFYYNKTDNGFSQITLMDVNTNIQATKFLNSFNIEIFGLSESFTFKRKSYWESHNSFDLSYSKTNSLISFTNQNREGFNSYFSTNNTFNLNSAKTIIFNINFWLSPSGVSDLDKMGATNQLDASMRFLFLNKKLQLVITANDITSSNRPNFISYSNNLRQEYKNYYDNRFFRISLTYKFGNKNINVDKRNFGNEDEKERTN
ncbi:MAG: TonB-dependent receptor [Gelidibacter sp.]|nr:TonB-dependent receptor [Gelidibacter sp.]